MPRNATKRPVTKKPKKRKSARPSLKKQGRVLRSKKTVKNTNRKADVKKRATSDKLPVILICLGLAMISIWGVHKYLYFRALSLSRSQVAAIIREEPKTSPLPTHIFIPWNTDADIESLALGTDGWQISDARVTYLLGSARPGEAGNIILYGHNKREILGNIRALKGGEKITLTTEDGKAHIYFVKSVKEVEPTEVSLLNPTPKETLTMYTCSGFWDSKRFVVTALPELFN